MILESIKRDVFAREAGLVTHDGEVSEHGLAELLRAPLARWGLSPRVAVLRHARGQLEAAGLLERASDLAGKVLERMLQLGECAEVGIGHERYLAPAAPRWIRTGEESAALLSVAPTPEGIVEFCPENGGTDIVRRVQVRGEEDLAALRMAGVREISFEEWLQPYGYLPHAMRRRGCPVRSDEFSLFRFWELLVTEATRHGLPLGGEGEVRVAAGEPGGYFGQYNAPDCEGRWSNVAPDGVWCAYRRGYGTAHWIPTIVVVDGGQRRTLDLYDGDEWRWALLARGRSSGTDERVERTDAEVRVSFPAPYQLVTAMDILGPQRGAWSWEVSPAAPDPWMALG